MGCNFLGMLMGCAASHYANRMFVGSKANKPLRSKNPRVSYWYVTSHKNYNAVQRIGLRSLLENPEKPALSLVRKLLGRQSKIHQSCAAGDLQQAKVRSDEEGVRAVGPLRLRDRSHHLLLQQQALPVRQHGHGQGTYLWTGYANMNKVPVRIYGQGMHLWTRYAYMDKVRIYGQGTLTWTRYTHSWAKNTCMDKVCRHGQSMHTWTRYTHRARVCTHGKGIHT